MVAIAIWKSISDAVTPRTMGIVRIAWIPAHISRRAAASRDSAVSGESLSATRAGMANRRRASSEPAKHSAWSQNTGPGPTTAITAAPAAGIAMRMMPFET